MRQELDGGRADAPSGADDEHPVPGPHPGTPDGRLSIVGPLGARRSPPNVHAVWDSGDHRVLGHRQQLSMRAEAALAVSEDLIADGEVRGSLPHRDNRLFTIQGVAVA
ncbi:hypothetical protein ACFFX0_14150 [Citricoccus parietis]|uniref:Uncharacterized protein n=1 Tax=Citricoccus parietis TaxID=592307 RepID=A0ABV5G054_9MICC